MTIRSCDWSKRETDELLRLRAIPGMSHAVIARSLTAFCGRPISIDAVQKKLGRIGQAIATPRPAIPPPPPAADRFEEDEAPTEPHQPVPEAGHPEFERLVELAKRATKRGEPLTLERLCDVLRMPPADVRDLVDGAVKAGYSVDVLHGNLEFRKPEPQRQYVTLSHPYEPGEEQLLGVASDWHVCSKHFERDQFCRHIDWLLEQGVRHVIAPGDLVAGGYRFLKHEVTHTGIEDQSATAAELIASHWGNALEWHAIAGNHCESFDVGIDATRMIQRHMQERGLHNFHYHGARGGRIILAGTRIELWHPGGGLAYALTYKTQRHIDATAPDDRPHFLFVGHYHQEILFRRGGVHALLCGTFENGDSSFGRMIGGDVALGGWLLRYRMGSDGRIAELTPTFREYPQTKMQWVGAA